MPDQTVRPGWSSKVSWPRGPLAVAVTVQQYPAPPARRTPHEMVTLIEDLIRVLDRASGGYRHDRRPTQAEAATLATIPCGR